MNNESPETKKNSLNNYIPYVLWALLLILFFGGFEYLRRNNQKSKVIYHEAYHAKNQPARSTSNNIISIDISQNDIYLQGEKLTRAMFAEKIQQHDPEDTIELTISKQTEESKTLYILNTLNQNDFLHIKIIEE